MEPDYQGRRVVVVDDDPFQLKMMSHMLNKMGLPVENVATCQSGGELLDLQDVRLGDGQLMLLDLNMPDMDGVEVVRQLAERHYAGALALVSGEDPRVLETVTTLARARQLNVLGHLDKPVRLEALRTLLGQWLNSSAGTPRAARRVYGPDEVHRAIAGGELWNAYQPKVDVATGELRGVETLVRWRHPEDGVVFPDQFIGVAEEHGLIDDLTRVVLTQALAQAKRWRDEGVALRVAVNVSMDNLTKLDFADYVVSEVTRSGFPPSDLILEITESRLMKDVVAPLDILTRLRIKRISLSIDDFGTGHSSLAQLRDMPFDELKIDRGFVHGAAANPTIRGIFEGSLAIAAQLGMSVVAEGVEDADDWYFLRAHNCHLAQGYFVAKPMPAGELRPWLATWEQRRPELVDP